MKQMLKEAAWCAVILFFAVAILTGMFVGMALIHAVFMEFVVNNCYTNFFGDVVCLVPK